MGRYAKDTSVSVDRSRAEIEKILQRYGADCFGYAHARSGAAQIEFQADGRHIRFFLPMPSADDDEFVLTTTGNRRSESAAWSAWEKACRQRWRALALAIKAKLEAVECGITEFDEEFLAHIVDPATGKTVGQAIRPQIEASYMSNEPQPLLLEQQK